MSAFICNNSHVTALAVYAARNRMLGWTDANQIGEMLHAENVKSVNYRYGEATQPDFALCEWAAFQVFSRVQVVKAARCLDISPASIPAGRRATPAHLVRAIIAAIPRGTLPGWDEAEWEITPPATNAA